MNILFLTLSSMNNINSKSLYNDLIRELNKRGLNIYVVSPRQKRESLPTELCKEGNINILKIETGNITRTKSFIEKGISTMKIENQYLSGIKKHFKNIKFDMIIYSTPPITFNKILKYFKNKYDSTTYLMLKDIFPQNAVDIELIKKNGLIYNYFRKKEKELYNNSDFIGCMSKGNVDYVLKNNEHINKNKVEVFPNAVKPIPRIQKRKKDLKLLDEYDILRNDTIFIYGGNLGKPQGIDFLLDVAKNFHRVKDAHLLIVGDGTEFNRIKNFIKNNKVKYVSIYEKLPKEKYYKLMNSADIGLIFLDKRFTIPNFPSRLLSYMENSIPILAATDVNTDIKDTIENSKSGYWCESGDIECFINHANKLAENKKSRENMGLNGRLYLEENYDIRKTVDIMLKHLYGDETNV